MNYTRLYMWGYILVSVLISLTSVRGVDLIRVQNAVEEEAVCLDGSPAAYQFDKGMGDGMQNWLVFLEGGGWCDSTNNCQDRTKYTGGLGSSNYMTVQNFTGILSNEQQLNPYFYNWNRVFVRYCDGASYTGNKVDLDGKLYYKGAKIFEVIIKELLQKGMGNASNALLSGCSAGGLGATLNCEKFRSLLPTTTVVKCASDGGYFLHIKDVFGRFHFAEYFNKIVELHGSTENLHSSCTSNNNPKSLCFYPEYVVPLIQTPFFIMHSAYDLYQIGNIFAPGDEDLSRKWEKCKNDLQMCSTDQLQKLKEFRTEFVQALPRSTDGFFRGMFIDNCQIHCQAQYQEKWYGKSAPKLDNKTIAEALGDWFYGRRAFQEIDNESDLPKICA